MLACHGPSHLMLTNVCDIGKLQASGHGSPEKSPRKAFSFPSMTGIHESAEYWGELRVHQQESKQATSAAKVEDVLPATVSQADDVSLMLDIKGRSGSGRFSDDDSDGSSYSSVCSDEENSPTPSASSSVTSSSPLLRRAPSGGGFQTLHSEASEHSSIDSIPRQEKALEGPTSAKDERPKPRLSLDMSMEKHLSPKLSPNKLRVRDDSAVDSDDDLPDWLRERTVLSPPASTIKTPARSPQQIEDEIRFAVDSAAARVQQELGRREQFQSALQSAAAYPGTPMNGDNQSAISKLFPGDDGNDFKLSDGSFDAVDEKDTQPLPSNDVIVNDKIQGELLLLMEVVIGDGRTETIEIHEGDSPDALASTFAQKHALKPDAVPKLRGLIQDQLDALAETEQEETLQPEQSAADDWANDWSEESFVSPSTAAFVAPEASIVPIRRIRRRFYSPRMLLHRSKHTNGKTTASTATITSWPDTVTTRSIVTRLTLKGAVRVGRYQVSLLWLTTHRQWVYSFC